MENRTFIPGSEWIYFKLYTGTNTADSVLKTEINSYINEMIEHDIIEKWFFIRYSDPDFHIRLRLRLKETQDFNTAYRLFYKTFAPVVDAGLIWKIQCDTYEREIERYGSSALSIVEYLFFIDSEFIIRLLNQLNEDNSDQQRWQLALALIDSFLSAFSFDLLQRKDFLNTMAENCKKEFGFTRHQVSKQLNDKCRYYRKEIENALLWENDSTNVADVIKSRRKLLIPIAEKLSVMEKSGELGVSMKSLITSMIHMCMNRWFRTKNRLHEMVIYEFLSRYYASEISKRAIMA